MNISKAVAEYNELRSKSKFIKSRMDELAKSIKEYLKKNVTPDAKGSYYEESNEFVYGNMAKKSVKLNQDKAKEFFTQRNLLEDVTDVKVVLNEDKIEKVLQEGKITQEELESLVDIKVSYSIDIKEKKQEDEIVEVQVVSSSKPKRKSPFKVK